MGIKPAIFFMISICCVLSHTKAQQYIDLNTYTQKKSTGQLTGNENIQHVFDAQSQAGVSQELRSSSVNSCGCYIEPDTSYTLAMQPNDDGSTALINLPFDFCFYGTQMSDVYINNNGNVSFNTPFATYSGVSFPSTNFEMVAPFWGDVDTRISGGVAAGEVYYKITPTAIYVNWVDVGYYNMQSDKRNTFQLILTDGNDPILEPGQNVAFCYKTMEWTTGSASGGTNGFGGTPSTVGANKGDGIDFIQFGRFDTAGSSYDGPFGQYDGVDWLSDQSFLFNACNSTNIPPIYTNVELCDTFYICLEDTLDINFSVLAPEQSQICTIQAVNAPPGFQINSNISGVSASLDASFVGSSATVGFNTLSFMAFDNATPRDTTYGTFVVFVDSTVLIPVVQGDSVLCDQDSVLLTVQGGSFDSYQWSTGANDTLSSIRVPAGNYGITVTEGNCVKSIGFDVNDVPIPTVQIIGDPFFCIGDTSIYTVLDTFDTYLWSTADTNFTTALDTSANLWIEVSKNGCFAADSLALGLWALPEPSITGDSLYCLNSLAAIETQFYEGYLWSTGDTTSQVQVTEGVYAVLVTDTNGCSNVSDTFRVALVVPNPSIYGDTIACTDEGVLLSGDSSNQSFVWSTGDTSQSVFVPSGTYQLTVKDSIGCLASSSRNIVDGGNPIAEFTSEPFLKSRIGDPIYFFDASSTDLGGLSSWWWNFGITDGPDAFDQDPSTIYSDTGSYMVTLAIQDEFGCVDSVFKTVSVVLGIEASNVITPNGDGINDYLVFENLDLYGPSHLVIYNRWGQVIYERDYYKNNWDAYDISDGVYFYSLTIPELGETINGHVTIVGSVW